MRTRSKKPAPPPPAPDDEPILVLSDDKGDESEPPLSEGDAWMDGDDGPAFLSDDDEGSLLPPASGGGTGGGTGLVGGAAGTGPRLDALLGGSGRPSTSAPAWRVIGADELAAAQVRVRACAGRGGGDSNWGARFFFFHLPG